MTTIREATEVDVPAVVGMAMAFIDAVYAGRLAKNPEQCAVFARSLIANDDAVLLIADRGDPVGMFGMMVYLHPMSGERIAAELAWWVNPDARGVGLRLLHRGEVWARAKGAAVLQMIAPSDDVAQLYERLGFDRIETSYQRRLT